MNTANQDILSRIRILVAILIAGLIISGVTAIPLSTELNWLRKRTGTNGGWIAQIDNALREIDSKYPFIAYGTDWLAFAHFLIAIVFIGPLRDPVRNIWVIEFGIIACVLVVPFAFVMGSFRGIPLGWRLIDCTFAIIAIVPLWLCKRLVAQLTSRAASQ